MAVNETHQNLNAQNLLITALISKPRTILLDFSIRYIFTNYEWLDVT